VGRIVRSWKLNSFQLIVAVVLSLSVSQHALAFDFESLVEDQKEYALAPTNWHSTQWALFGTSVMAVGATMQWDDTIRNEISSRPELRSSKLAHVGNAWGEFGGVGLTLGMYGAGFLYQNKQWMTTADNMTKAAIISGLTTRMIKISAGRLRPDQADTSSSWGYGGSSFSSGHTTQAFALSVAFAESVPNPSLLRRLTAYSLATSTAYARMHDSRHWLSDTVAGAIIGSATAYFIVNKSKKRKARGNWDIIVLPQPDGSVTIGTEKSL
jgi:hypothetical protein